jgi:hypothetical protein
MEAHHKYSMFVIHSLTCLSSAVIALDNVGKSADEIFAELKSDKYELPKSVQQDDERLMQFITTLINDNHT